MRLPARIIALVAGVLYIATILFAAWLLLHNLSLTIILGLIVSLLAYAAWLIFVGDTRQARLGWLYCIVGFIAGLAILKVFWKRPNNFQVLLLTLVVSAVYFGLVSLLRDYYWRERRRLNQKKYGAAHFKHPYLIINPKSGDGRAIKARIPQLARQQKIKVMITKAGDDVGALASQAVKAGADVLGVSGGDGSIGAVAKVALQHNLPIVVLPGGTRCHFARDLGLDPKRITDSLAGFTGLERQVDVGDINGRIFLNNASLGLYADIVDDPDYRENKVKVSRRILRSVVSGQIPLYDLHFQYRRKKFKQAAQLLVGVGSYKTVNLLELGQREKLDSGKLQVTALLTINSQLVKKLLRPLNFNKLKALHQAEVFLQWETTQFTINTSQKTVVVGVDGEREKYGSPVFINIKPRALRIYVPAEGVRNRPTSPLSWYMFRRLWATVANGNPDN